MSHAGDLSDLIREFTVYIGELKEQVVLRDASAQQDNQWAELSDTLNNLEVRTDAIAARLAADAAAEPQIQELIRLLEEESQYLARMEAFMDQVEPTQPPREHGLQPAPAAARQRQAERAEKVAPLSGGSKEPDADKAQPPGTRTRALPLQDIASNVQAARQEGGGERKGGSQHRGKGPGNSLRLVTADEMASLSSYMRGRLTEAKVNAMLEDMVQQAQANQKLILTPLTKVPAELEAKHQILSNNFFTKEQRKARMVVLESDLRGGPAAKQIITVLRHLGHVVELREAKGTRVLEIV